MFVMKTIHITINK